MSNPDDNASKPLTRANLRRRTKASLVALVQAYERVVQRHRTVNRLLRELNPS